MAKKREKFTPPFSVTPKMILRQDGKKVCILQLVIAFKYGTLTPDFVMIEVTRNRKKKKTTLWNR